LDFSYSADATGLGTGIWTPVDSLNFFTPSFNGAAGATDGNSPGFRTPVAAVITGLNVANGQTFWIRWVDFNASGADDGLAVDDFSLTPNPPAIDNPQTLPSGTATLPYGPVTLTASGGSGTGYTFAVAAGSSLPAGLSLNGAVLSGAPATAAGSPFTFTLQVTDSNNAKGYKTFTLAVNPLLLLTIAPATLPDGSANAPYSQTLTVPGGVACSFSSTGTLPPGLILSAPGNTNTATLSGTPTLPGPFSFTVNGSCSNGDAAQSYAVKIALACGTTKTSIHDIQGTTDTSPLAGSTVEVEGVVVGSFQGSARLSGFFLQEPDGSWDSNPKTSEGIFVFDGGSGVPVNTGDRVRARGVVSEYKYNATSPTTLTEIGSITALSVCATGQSFTRTTITLPVASFSDFEQYEGMAVRFTQQLIVTGNNDLGQFGSVDLAPSRLFSPTQVALPGPASIAAQDLNSRSTVTLDDGSSNQDPFPTLYPQGGLVVNTTPANTLRVGDIANAPIDGVLDNHFGAYAIQPTVPVTFTKANPRPAPNPAVGGRIRVVSANLLNFFTTLGSPNACGPNNLQCRGASDANEYNRQVAKMVAALTGAGGDIFAVMELENNSSAAVQAVVAALNAATAPGTYTYIDTGVTGTDAIHCAIIYKPAVVTPVGSFAVLPDAGTPFGNRPSIAQTFRPASGAKPDLQNFTVVVNHWRSKGSSCGATDPDLGDGAGNCNLNRLAMAQLVINWVATNPTNDPTPAARRKILMVGDYNAYLKEDPIRAITDPAFSKPGFPANANAIFRDLIDKIIGAGAYSFNFNSASGYLDHALANAEMDHGVAGLVEWHNNADEPSVLDYNTEFKTPAAQAALYAPDGYRASDHDPIVIGLNPLPGDVDDNGAVDIGDAEKLLLAIGRRVSNVDRRLDFDGDGMITLNDYRIWFGYYLAYHQ
jgi:predicted extracellular nuclease